MVIELVDSFYMDRVSNYKLDINLVSRYFLLYFFFLFNDTATTEIYTLSLHDALPIWRRLYPPKNLPVRPTTDFAREALFNILQNRMDLESVRALDLFAGTGAVSLELLSRGRSEEHTSELQSRRDLVCRLLLEKKKQQR